MTDEMEAVPPSSDGLYGALTDWLHTDGLVTATVEYGVSDIVDLIRRERIALLPDYQRRFGWNPVQQSRLIESLLLNIPIPSVYLVEDHIGHYSVIDGRQRLTAIDLFLRDRLALTGLTTFAEFNGRRYADLPQSMQSRIVRRGVIRATIILSPIDGRSLVEVFSRLSNGGGHSLNRQEIRNSLYSGDLTELIYDLATSKILRDSIGIKAYSRSDLYVENQDTELVLRFIALVRDWTHADEIESEYYLDNFLASHQSSPRALISEFRSAFESAIRAVHSVFGSSSFRRWDPVNHNWRKKISTAVYDAQMIALAGIESPIVGEQRLELLEGFRQLSYSSEFSEVTEPQATNDPYSLRRRIALVRDLVNSITFPR